MKGTFTLRLRLTVLAAGLLAGCSSQQDFFKRLPAEVLCPAGYSGSGSVCARNQAAACPTGMSLDLTLGLCVSNTNAICPSSHPVLISGSCYLFNCSQGSLEPDNRNCRVTQGVLCPTTLSYGYDASTDKCASTSSSAVSCPSSYSFVTSGPNANLCVGYDCTAIGGNLSGSNCIQTTSPGCPAGFSPDGSGNCTATPACNAGFIFNGFAPAGTQCTQKSCPGGYTLNGAGTKCGSGAGTCSCPSGSSWGNDCSGFSPQHWPACKWNPSGCPNPDNWVSNANNYGLVCSAAGSDQTQCVTAGSACYSALIDPTITQVSATCSAGTLQWLGGMWKCAPTPATPQCPSGYSPSGSSCQKSTAATVLTSAPSCRSVSFSTGANVVPVWESALSPPRCDTAPLCNAGFTRSAGQCTETIAGTSAGQVPPDCTAFPGSTWNANAAACTLPVTCASGYRYQNGQCVSTVASTCPTGSTYNPTQNKCVF